MKGRTHGRRHHLARKLLAMLVASFVLAAALSSVVLTLTRDDVESAPRVVQRHLQRRLARVWDDERATEAEVAALRDSTGLDVRAVRDTSRLPDARRLRGGAVVVDGDSMFFPVQRGPQVIGALEIRGVSGVKPRASRLLLALGCVLAALAVVARHGARSIARPLERVAEAAERFGRGDLAARSRLEELPRRWLSDEVRGVGTAFDGMASRIERTVRDQRELLAAISHELRSPLGRARVGVELLRAPGDLDADARGARLDRLERELATVDTILGDLLAAARAGLTDLRTEEVTVVPFVRELVARFAENHPDVELVVEGDERASRALDRGLFGRAIANLLANADAHGGRDRLVTVGLRASDDELVLTVDDDGPGFPEALLPRLFDPFVRGGDPARSPGRPDDGAPAGLGLGLTLVRRIVEAHGGSVAAENRPAGGDRPGGARIVVRLAEGPARAVP